MLTRELIRLLSFICPAILAIFLLAKLYNTTLVPLQSLDTLASKDSKDPNIELQPSERPPNYVSHIYSDDSRREIFSASTADKKYFKINFHPFNAINANAIPHPTLENTWIVVAQLDDHSVKDSVWFAELFCNAAFKGGELSCIDPPLILSIGNTPVRARLPMKMARLITLFQPSEKCVGDLSWFKLSIGPHDARVFYGPSTPYAIFGSNSQHTCFGLWMQDFRVLVDWPFEFHHEKHFRTATELQRPKPYGPVEKNYFVFWDKDETIYAHFDILPKRVFAKLSDDGSVGPDLAPKAASDEKCMDKYMPKFPPEDGSIHQATNSISITLCKRSECEPNDSNTFILTIFHKKKTYSDDGYYDSYVMLFQRNAPFAVHGISTKPFWISGRGKPKGWKHEDGSIAERAQMMYVTSVSWKKAGLKYHGYIDDVLFILFGIEDDDTGGIDIIAGDLLVDLALCSSA